MRGTLILPFLSYHLSRFDLWNYCIPGIKWLSASCYFQGIGRLFLELDGDCEKYAKQLK